jgi:hypothetical protein
MVSKSVILCCIHDYCKNSSSTICYIFQFEQTVGFKLYPLNDFSSFSYFGKEREIDVFLGGGIDRLWVILSGGHSGN